MNSNVSIPVNPATGANTALRDSPINTASGNGAPSGQHKFAAVLDRVRTDEPRTQTQTQTQTQAQAQAQNDAAVATAGSAKPDKPVSCVGKDAGEQPSDDDQDDVSDDAAMELLLLMAGNAPATPVPVAADAAGTLVTDTATEGVNLVGAATELQSLAGKLPTMSSASTSQVQVSNQNPVTAQLPVPAQSQTTLADKAEDQALPSWLLKGAADATDAIPEKQNLLELGQSMMRMLDGDERAPDNKRTSVIGSGDLNLAASLSVLGSAAGTQSVQDWNAAQQTPQVLHAPVGSTAWTAELGNKLVILSKQETPVATLHVTPADLGPVQIRIETQQNQANVWFTAGHPDTRSAIEQSLPKLREMFESQGLMLNDAGVFSDRSGQQTPYQSPHSAPQWSSMHQDTDADVADTARIRTLSLSMVDTYA